MVQEIVECNAPTMQHDHTRPCMHPVFSPIPRHRSKELLTVAVEWHGLSDGSLRAIGRVEQLIISPGRFSVRVRPRLVLVFCVQPLEMHYYNPARAVVRECNTIVFSSPRTCRFIYQKGSWVLFPAVTQRH
jgi:hypothetical protein